MNKLLWIIAFIAVGVTAVTVYRNSSPQTTTTPDAVVEESQDTAAPYSSNPSGAAAKVAAPDVSTWETYTSPTHGFTISFPPDVTHETAAEGERFYKWGPTQTGQTEMYDGLRLEIRSGTYAPKTFAEFVDEQYEAKKSNPDIRNVGEKQNVTVGGMPAVSYRIEAFGDGTQIFVDRGEGRYLDITDATVEPADRETLFPVIVDAMINSIR